MMTHLPRLKPAHLRIAAGLAMLAGAAILAGAAPAAAAPASAATQPFPAAQASALHPVFPLLDANGDNVLDSGAPISTMQTCGACHDTAFIAEHNAHEGVLSGEIAGPAGELLVGSPDSGRLEALDPAAAEGEMNCFLCHTAAPNNTARLGALLGGQLDWANTATLAGSGIVEQDGEAFTWNPAAFDDEGNLLPEYIIVQDPGVENCGQCHGVATDDAFTPLVLNACATEQRMTITTGQVFSPQRIADSGLNLTDKDSLSRSWDVHAERIVGCTDCHYALNNPAYAAESAEDRPEHLLFDPRRLEPGEFLSHPMHEFARSDADALTQEPCAACHEVKQTHTWLPYTERHMEELACESCHVPRMELPARQSFDWTVLTADGGPAASCRGIEGEPGTLDTLMVGYEPAMLPRENADGSTSVAPYNLITTWTWVYGYPPKPVSLDDLRAVYLEGDGYAPEVLAALDADGSGALDRTELRLDTQAKTALIAGRLEALGLSNPRIVGQVDAYAINHGVTHGDWAIRDCRACHGDGSRLAQPIELMAGGTPGAAIPDLASGSLESGGEIVSGPDGALLYQPLTGAQGSQTYIFGFSRVKAIDWIGIVMFLGTMLAVIAHGGLRVVAAMRGASHAPDVRRAYMYGIYERLWHWLQTAAILMLIFTGLIIHKPDTFAMFSFRGVVAMHNILAVILVINATLSAFYHLVSGEIRQFLPRPYGFFDQAIVQAKFYLSGIFRGEEHPFAKTPERKLNPLQQVVYLGLLNVLLPLQIITGALMWGVQRWPEIASRLGGLPLLAPAHSLVAWMLASFVIGHVYLTTTGPTPLASIKGMIMGWDEVEVPSAAD
jgi:thiosulfate reductase cytochrome b subunit